MSIQKLVELRCENCGGVGIAEASQIGALRTRVAGSHLGHRLSEVPYVAATDDAQLAATTIVSRRSGIFVYSSSDPS